MDSLDYFLRCLIFVLVDELLAEQTSKSSWAVKFEALLKTADKMYTTGTLAWGSISNTVSRILFENGGGVPPQISQKFFAKNVARIGE